jgi:hypothetical protein
VTMAYCVKCRAQREVRNPQRMIMKNRREAVTGVCPVCGTKLFRIGEQVESDIRAVGFVTSQLPGRLDYSI